VRTGRWNTTTDLGFGKSEIFLLNGTRQRIRKTARRANQRASRAKKKQRSYNRDVSILRRGKLNWRNTLSLFRLRAPSHERTNPSAGAPVGTATKFPSSSDVPRAARAARSKASRRGCNKSLIAVFLLLLLQVAASFSDRMARILRDWRP
jgi:hypothetical protein